VVEQSVWPPATVNIPTDPRYAAAVLRSIAVIVQAPVALFELGVLAEVFGIDRTDDGVPAFDYRVCAEFPGVPLPAGPATAVIAAAPLSATEDADLVAVICSSQTEPPTPAVLDAIRDAHRRGVHLMALCTGAFALAHAGVVDGRRVAAHWRYARQLADRRPEMLVDADILYYQDGPVVSCAGTAAGIDACLHLVRSELGPAIANRIARRMVVPAHRRGTQRQLLAEPVATEDKQSVQPVLQWIDDHLDEAISLKDLAAVANISERTLLRRFNDQTGGTPYDWLTHRRIVRAQELLAHSTEPVESVARMSGFTTAHLLRHHFREQVNCTPTEFRRRVTRATETRRDSA
jgi:transcriptional regulator GlxA family with amidase domain